MDIHTCAHTYIHTRMHSARLPIIIIIIIRASNGKRFLCSCLQGPGWHPSCLVLRQIWAVLAGCTSCHPLHLPGEYEYMLLIA
eukprot:1142850-Pelagomonas_calceolata.AAC.3